MAKPRRLCDADKTQLLSWYRANQRPLPWRLNRDPYRIWISETMLQQTTVTAVIPYYERFLQRFPTLTALAEAKESEVRAQWAGLGYYSRASNLWRAAVALAKTPQGFPQTFEQLLDYPGFGPYTARAVASLAFDQNVGVLDGNVIRVLSRVHGWSAEWWKPNVRREFQSTVDQWVENTPSHEMNQAIMELGATICTPKSPSCLLCPLQNSCQALNGRRRAELPTPKPRRAREIWLWEAEIHLQKGKVALIQGHQLPFLKGHWVPPGQAKKLKVKPQDFHFSHSVTHHDIFVRVKNAKNSLKIQNVQWVTRQNLAEVSPTNLVKKVLDHYEK